MKYEVTEIGAEGPDEPGFIMFHPRGQRQYQFEEVMWDYAPAEGDDLLEEVLIEVLPGVAREARKLGLRAPFVVLADLSDRTHLARHVVGTESEGSVFLLDPAPTLEEAGWRLTRGVEDSLYHELGHAYLRSQGVPHYDDMEPEEEAVEEFALGRDRGVLDRYAAEAGEDE